MKKIAILAAFAVVGSANALTFDSGTGLGWAIPDNDGNGVSQFLNVTGLAGTITQVEIYFSPGHTWSGDVAIELHAPDTTFVDMLENPGAAAANSGASNRDLNSIFFADTGLNAEFWGDEATFGAVDSAVSGDVYAHSTLFSSSNLSDIGTVNGTYEFRLWDLAAGDTGSIDRVVIHTDAVPEPASMAALGLGALALIRRKRSK